MEQVNKQKNEIKRQDFTNNINFLSYGIGAVQLVSYAANLNKPLFLKVNAKIFSAAILSIVLYAIASYFDWNKAIGTYTDNGQSKSIIVTTDGHKENLARILQYSPQHIAMWFLNLIMLPLSVLFFVDLLPKNWVSSSLTGSFTVKHLISILSSSVTALSYGIYRFIDCKKLFSKN